MLRNMIIALCLLAPALGLAKDKRPLGTLLDAVALNAGASSLTFYVGKKADCGRNNSCDPTSSTDNAKGPLVRDYDAILLEMSYDYTATTLTITLTCYGGQTRATASGRIPSATLSSGTYTLTWSGVITTPSMAADTIWPVEFNIKSDVTKCVVSSSGSPGATDKITVTGWLIKD